MTAVEMERSEKPSETPPSFLRALAAVQAAMPPLKKDKVNPHFRSKFTGLDTIVETVQPLLAEHGLVWITMPDHDASGPTLDYRLTLAETGEGLHGSMPLLLTKADPQAHGSALTYARRYALVCVLNLIADDDDDGNASSGYGAPRQAPQGNAPQGDTRNMQDYGKGLGNPALLNAFKAAGLPAPEHPWPALAQVPVDKASALYAALVAAKSSER